MTRTYFKSQTFLCTALCLIFVFGFSNYAGALTATENLTVELGQLATRADTLQGDITKAKADPQTDSVALQKLLADADVIKNRVTEIVGFFNDAPSASEVKAGPTAAVCGGVINLIYKAPASGTVVSYELSRNPYDASLPQANFAWGVVASGVSLDSLPKTQANLSVGISYKYQLRAIGKGGVDSFSEIVTIKSSAACPPPTPIDLPVTAITSSYCGGKIELSWTKASSANSKDAVGYIIYRLDKDPYSVAELSFDTIKIRGINTIKYTDATPTVSTKYWYYVFPATASELAVELPVNTNAAGVILAQQSVSRGYSGSQVFQISGSGAPVASSFAVSSGSCGPISLKVVPECYNDRGVKGKGPFHESNFLSWGAVSNASGYYVYRRDVTVSKNTSFEKVSLRQCKGLISVAGCADGLYTQSDGYISKDYEYKVTAVVSGKETESSNTVFQEGYADACPGAEKQVLNPDLTPAQNTPTSSDGETNASWVDTSATPAVTYFTPGKKAKIDGGVLNIGTGAVPAGKHFNVRFQKSNTQTFDPTNVGVVDVAAPAGGLLKDGKIPVSYNYSSVAGDDGKTFYFRYCVDQPPTDNIGNVLETQGANDSSVSPAVGEYNNCSDNTVIKFKSKPLPEKPTCDCSAINSSLTMPQSLTASARLREYTRGQVAQAGALVIAANAPNITGTKDIDADNASVIKLVWSSTGAETVSLFKVLLDGTKVGGNLIIGNLGSGEISLTNLAVGEYDYVFTATNLGGECVSKVHFNIIAVPPPNPDLIPNDIPEISGPAGSTYTERSGDSVVTYFTPGTTLTLKAQPKNKGLGNVPLGSTFNVKFQAKLHSAAESSYNDLANTALVSPPFSVLASGAAVQKSPSDQRPTVTHGTSASLTSLQEWDFRYCVDMPPNDYAGKVLEKQSVYTNVNNNPDKIKGVGEYNNCSGATTIRIKPKQLPPATLSLKVRKAGVDPYTHDLLTVEDADRVDLTWNYTGTSACKASWKTSSGISAVDTDLSVGPLHRSGSPYTYTVTCGTLSDKVTVNVKPPVIIDNTKLSCVLDIRPYKDTGTFGKSVILFTGEEAELQWRVTGARSVSLFKFALNARAGDNLVAGNNPNGMVKEGRLSVGQYQYKLTATDKAGVAQICSVSVLVNTAPKPDLVPSSPLDVYGPKNPDGSLISGEKITLSAVPKNIGGSPAGAFNLRFEYKFSSDPNINHYTPLLKTGVENFARVPNGLGARLTLPMAVGITHTSDKNETAAYDFRYCVDLPQTLNPQNSGIAGNVNEVQVSDTEDKVNGVGEHNNCSSPKSARFAPPPPPPNVPSGRISCGTLTSGAIELSYTYSTAVKPSLFKDGGTVPVKTFTSGDASGLYSDTGLTSGSTHTYRLRNSDAPSSELLGSATCTTRGGSALSVECKVLPDHLDLSLNSRPVWRADTKGTGVPPYKFKWLSGDGLLGLNPQSDQSNPVYDVTLDYEPQSTARNHKTGRIQVEDSAREREDEPQIVTAICGLPGTESLPVSEGSLTASCKVSDPKTDVATGKRFVTWDAKIINTGIPDYTYVWKVGSTEDVSGRNKASVKIWAVVGSNPVKFPTGTVTIGDSFYWMRDVHETATASCGVNVFNSNDAFTLSVSPRTIMNFVSQKAVSSKVAIRINPDFGFESPITITPSGTVGGVPVMYAFYKRGATSSIKIPNTVTITRGEYVAADFGIDMVIESDKFISPGKYDRAVTVRGDGGGKKDTQFVSVDVNDSRPTFQNF